VDEQRAAGVLERLEQRRQTDVAVLGAQRVRRQREPHEAAVELVAQAAGVELGQTRSGPCPERGRQLERAVVVGVEQLARIPWGQQLDAERARRRDQREVEVFLPGPGSAGIGVVIARFDLIWRLARQLQGPPAQHRWLGAGAQGFEQALGPQVLVNIEVEAADALAEWIPDRQHAAPVAAGPHIEQRQLVEPVH
jgi:hypothetical protein